MALLPDVLAAGPVDLRRWRPGQCDALWDALAASFDELHRWMPWAAALPSPDDLSAVLGEGEAAFDADREWSYVLVEVDSAEVVGAAGLHPRSGPESIEIGYWVRTDRTRRGYATAAARALTDAAFHYLDFVERVEIHMDDANRASAAVPAKLGFSLVGVERREVLAPGHTGRGPVWAVDRATSRHG